MKLKRIDKLLRKRKPQPPDPHFISRLRVREMERIIQSRWGVVPDTDDMEDAIWDVARHLRPLAKKSLASILAQWCQRWAPHMPTDTVRGVAWQVNRYSRHLPKADTLAKRWQLTFEERARLRITTIGAIDMDQAKRKQRRSDEDRKRKEQKRMSDPNYRTREEYLAHSLSRTKPWIEAGVSRRTWERRRKAGDASPSARDASPSAAVYSIAAATLASASDPGSPTSPVAHPALWLAILSHADESSVRTGRPILTQVAPQQSRGRAAA